MENQGQANFSGAPPEKKRSAEQLATIHAAMMEELGVSRMDTLPLEDRGYRGQVPLTKLPERRKIPTNAAVARWHNIEFDDVDEATEQLDNIADGQLYRLRRGASSGPSHAPSGRGGHSSSNSFRGGRGGDPVRASPAMGGKGGVSSGREGRNAARSRGLYDMISSSTPTTFNDARRGVSNHARIERTIASLKGTPRSAPLPNKVPQAPSKPSPYCLTLSTPEAFMSAMGLKARPGNVPAPSSTPKVDTKPALLSTKATLGNVPTTDVSSASSIVRGISTTVRAPSTVPSKAALASVPSRSTSAATTVSAQPIPFTLRPTAAANPLSQPTPSGLDQPSALSTPKSASLIIGAVSANPMPAFVNRSTGLAASRWAATTTTTPGLPSFSNSSMSTTNASIASTSTISITTPVPVGPSTSAPVSNASSRLSNSNPSHSSPRATLFVVPTTTRIDNEPVASMVSPPSSATLNGLGTVNNSESLTTGPTLLIGRGVLIEKIVKASQNGSDLRLAKGRIVQGAASLILELEIGGVGFFQIPVFGRIFKFTTPTNMLLSADPDTYNVKFRFPHEASAFEKLLLNHLSTAPEPVALAVDPPAEAPVAADEPPTPNPDMGNSSATTLNATIASAEPVLNVSGEMNDSVLIDFSEDIADSPKSHSALDDLWKLNTDPMVWALLRMLNNISGGSFWDHSYGLSDEEILAKAEDRIGAYFAPGSNVFTKYLPADVKITFIKETSKSVLETARAQALELKANCAGLRENFDNTTYLNKKEASGVNQLNDHPQTTANNRLNYSQQQKTSGLNQLNDHSEPLNDHPQTAALDHLDYSQQQAVHEKKRKYTVTELFSLRGEACALKQDVVTRTKEIPTSSNVVSTRSRAKSASKQSDHSVGQGFWDPKPTNLEFAAGLSTEQKPQPWSQVTPAIPKFEQQDAALYASLLSSTGQNKPAQAQVKSNHHLAASKELTRLTGAFSGLKISAANQTPSVPISSYATPAVMAEPPVQSHPSLQAKTIVEVTNDPETMARAKVAGLSASKWSQPSPLSRQENLFSQRQSASSDFKPDVGQYPVSPPGSSRRPLFPRKIQVNIQERPHRSLAERHN